jgi:hypothetical protein
MRVATLMPRAFFDIQPQSHPDFPAPDSSQKKFKERKGDGLCRSARQRALRTKRQTGLARFGSCERLRGACPRGTMFGSQFVVPFVPPPRGPVPVERRLSARASWLHGDKPPWRPGSHQPAFWLPVALPRRQAPRWRCCRPRAQSKWFAPQGKMACAADKNGLRDQAK